jgi:hypothetical protein
VLEKGDAAGGSMLLSSGVDLALPEFDEFRARVPGRRRAAAAGGLRRLDEALEWLESLGAPSERGDREPAHDGRRFDPQGLTDTLGTSRGDVRVGQQDSHE